MGSIGSAGCAEGYYAVGIARRLPKCHIWAFDIDSEAQRLCAEMIALNQVQDRVHLEGACTSEKLRRLFGDSLGLIVSDCEAFEFQLFNRPCIEGLSNCDLVIEYHELLSDNSLPEFIERFQATHSTLMIESIEDFRKAKRTNIRKSKISRSKSGNESLRSTVPGR